MNLKKFNKEKYAPVRSFFILNPEKQMAEETIKTKLEEFVTHSSELGQTAYKLAQVNAIRKTANISANLIFKTSLIIIALISIIFFSAAAAWWLGDLLNSHAIGFLITGGFYLLLFTIVLLLRSKFFLPYFRNKIVQKIYE